MLTLSSNEQAESLVKDGVLAVNDDIEIAFDGFRIEADIKCRNIYSKDKRRDIKAWNIYALDITAGNIDARDIETSNISARNIDADNIKAFNITARNIYACNIDAWDIEAKDIYAWYFKAGNINARDISYHAVCFAYEDIICESIKGRRENSKHFSLDGDIIIKQEKTNVNTK